MLALILFIKASFSKSLFMTIVKQQRHVRKLCKNITETVKQIRKKHTRVHIWQYQNEIP